LANDVNEHMPDYVVRRLFSALNDQGKPIRGSRILLLGVSFKANVGDWRESPSHRVAHLLADLGAELLAADPHVAPDRFPTGVRPVEATPEEMAAADAVVLLVDHAAFDPAMILAHARYVLDTKASLPHAVNVERL
jgi:UDP-N-acetyl-D-mannosaminuronate dehydrogenase